MYEVLAYVYETYWGGEDCPGREQLGRRLSSAGFERDEIVSALTWLDGLHSGAQALAQSHQGADDAHEQLTAPGADSIRVFTESELNCLGAQGIACLHFLQRAGALPVLLRELVIERALASSQAPLALSELKVIVMMVYWRTGVNPGVLILDELCDSPAGRLGH